MDASQLSRGKANERNGDGRPINLPGIYTHSLSGKTIITAAGDEGVVQADALMQPRWQGQWKRTGDVPSRVDILAMQKAQEMKDAKTEAVDKKTDEVEIAKAVAAVK